MESIDLKLVSAILATIIGVGAFLPYLWDVIKKKTKPHTYTWLIWCLTQGTAVAGMWYGNAGWGGIALTIGLFFVFIIFLFSFKFGTRNIKATDTVILLAALAALFVWWQLDNPVAAVLMVSAIDILGYIPSWRKSITEPWAETLWSWSAFSIGNFFALLALTEYNLLTTTYLYAITFANLVLIMICLYYRKSIPKPN